MHGKLTTHVLDTYAGKPAAGMQVEWRRMGPAPEPEGGKGQSSGTLWTDSGGRARSPDLEGGGLLPGQYELRFHVGDYFRAAGLALPDPPFLDVIPVVFGIADSGASWHVPLLVSPWAYSTYRGS